MSNPIILPDEVKEFILTEYDKKVLRPVHGYRWIAKEIERRYGLKISYKTVDRIYHKFKDKV